MPSIVAINEKWSFTQVGGGEANAAGEWNPLSQFPTSAHAELVKAGKIPDPFVGLNEWEVQCELPLSERLVSSTLTLCLPFL